MAICECCGQLITNKGFDEYHADSVVIWDIEAKGLAEEDLYDSNSVLPELNSWERFKVYRSLPDEFKTQIKIYYKIQ